MILIVVFLLISAFGSVVLNFSEDKFVFDNYVANDIQTEKLILVSSSISQALEEFLNHDDKTIDHLGEFWAKPIPFSLEDISVTVEIADQERYLNPNFLINGRSINQKYFQIFERLFENLGIDDQILFNIIDWIDLDKVSNGGEEDYQDYSAKNAKLDTLEELYLIKGVSKEVYNGTVINGVFRPGLKAVLSPYSNGKVNINTAPKWVLMALDRDIDETIANSIIAYRQKRPFKRVDDLINVDGMNSDIIYRIKPFTTVKSEHFLANINIKIGDREYKFIVLLERKNKTKTIWEKIY